MCIWSVEADILDFDNIDILDRIYQNNAVQRFLDASDSMGIAACKGMGKTFLLKAKRMQLQRDNNSLLILPKDRLVDVSGTISLENVHMKFLSSYDNWICMWISCIAIYILSLEKFNNIIEKDEFQELPDCVQNLLKKENSGVFNVLHRILNLKSKKNLNEVKGASSLLFDYVQRIKQSVVIFVDKLEEPFNKGFYSLLGDSKSAQGNYNASIWAYAQLSFSEAVYRLYSSRHHIKIYYGIRKEALYRGEDVSVEYNKLRDRVVTLEYSPDELYEMFSLYITKENENDLFYPEYIDENPIKALVGVDTILHRSGVEENVWDYIYRHTFQRPRDIMEMCMAIHDHIVKNKMLRNATVTEQIRELRHWINEISTMECRQYISTLEPFMSKSENIHFKEQITLFARTLPTNVFTRESMDFYCHTMNCNFDKVDCQKCGNIHFFSTLYNIGLLGYIHKSVNDQKYQNYIKHIGKSMFDTQRSSLPKGIIYYMHPGFGNIIQNERETNMLSYMYCPYIVNSFSKDVPSYQIRFIEDMISSIIGNKNENRVFITSTGKDNKSIRKKIKSILDAKGYDVVMYEDPKFPQMNPTRINKNIGAPQDHCIDEIMKCKHLIYIYGDRFGMPYVGEKYKPYIERHKNVIINEPSMSFVEYLVAKENGKNVKVYVDERVDFACEEFKANDRKDTYKSAVTDNNDVFKQLISFNDLGNGTWLDGYSDYTSLEEYINAHFPNIE